jgi:hypothetical protein
MTLLARIPCMETRPLSAGGGAAFRFFFSVKAQECVL